MRDHHESRHIELSPGWRLWRTVALRSAGMPLDWLTDFAVPAEASDEDRRARSVEAVRGMLRRDPFLTALTWQNPKLVRDWAGRYAEAVAGDPDAVVSRPRNYREAKLANYAQRYCAKNDTIGFFGPVSWARFDDDAPETQVEGTGDLASATVYFEVWAIQQLADSWAADPRLAPYLPVRLTPTVSFRDGVLRRPRRPAESVPRPRAVVLDTIDGRSCVREVFARAVATLGADPDAGPDTATDMVAAELDRLRDEGLVCVGFAVPIDESPMESLAAQLAHVSDEMLRRELADQLDRLESARREVASATGPYALLTALDQAEDTFAKLAGEAPDRQGRFGRVPLYLDCRRDVNVTVGAGEFDRLRAPLTLLLDSARWFVDQTAVELKKQLRLRYSAQRARTHDGVVSLADLVLVAADLLAGAPGTAVHEVEADFQARWEEIIPAGTSSEVRLSADAIAPLVAALFPAERLGWASAAYHSPDLMLGYLDGSDAPPVWVLGELHMALNTLENRMFNTQAVDRCELSAAAAEDMRAGRILPLYPSNSPEVTSRTYPPTALHLDSFSYWSFGTDSGHPRGATAWPAAGLLVQEEDGDLVVRTPDGSRRASALEFLGEFASALAVNHFKLCTNRRHNPRVRIDDLVVSRETWRLPAAELAAVAGRDYGVAGLRRYLRDLGIPRCAFYLTPAERKPSYVDLEAPLHLRNLATAVKRVLRGGVPDPHVTIVEMLPDPDQAWLTDPAQQRYTSEFRVVAVDTRPRDDVFGSGR